jgi:alpha-glucosidase (family GH31 glycosyl hydrolase)
MVYECEHCGYITTRRANFLRHKNRKNSCEKTKNDDKMTTHAEGTNVHAEGTNVHAEGTNVHAEGTNVHVVNIDVFQTLFCVKCKKPFSSKKGFQLHQQRCNGVNSKTCPICLKVFTSCQGKYNHLKNVKCFPPLSAQTPISHTINNITNNINNVSNCNNQNIQINVFGNEDLSYLTNDNGIIHRLRMYGKEGIYGLPKIIDDVHFNQERPENQTIIKPEEYGIIFPLFNNLFNSGYIHCDLGI